MIIRKQRQGISVSQRMDDLSDQESTTESSISLLFANRKSFSSKIGVYHHPPNRTVPLIGGGESCRRRVFKCSTATHKKTISESPTPTHLVSLFPPLQWRLVYPLSIFCRVNNLPPQVLGSGMCCRHHTRLRFNITDCNLLDLKGNYLIHHNGKVPQ